MSKPPPLSLLLHVLRPFVLGELRAVPGAVVRLSPAEARPLLDAGMVEIFTGRQREPAPRWAIWER